MCKTRIKVVHLLREDVHVKKNKLCFLSYTCQQKKECIELIKEGVKDKYTHKQGKVILDYVRIRLKAVKTAV